MKKHKLHKTMKVALATAILGGMLALGQEAVMADTELTDSPSLSVLTVQVEQEEQLKQEAEAKAAAEKAAAEKAASEPAKPAPITLMWV